MFSMSSQEREITVLPPDFKHARLECRDEASKPVFLEKFVGDTVPRMRNVSRKTQQGSFRWIFDRNTDSIHLLNLRETQDEYDMGTLNSLLGMFRMRYLRTVLLPEMDRELIGEILFQGRDVPPGLKGFIIWLHENAIFHGISGGMKGIREALELFGLSMDPHPNGRQLNSMVPGRYKSVLEETIARYGKASLEQDSASLEADLRILESMERGEWEPGHTEGVVLRTTPQFTDREARGKNIYEWVASMRKCFHTVEVL